MIKQNLSGVTLIDKKGVRVNPNIHLGESDGYISGDILDANAVQGTVNEAVLTAKEDIEDLITDLIGSAPEVLDTLAELADAIGDDPDFFNTINNELDQKVDKVSGKGLSTNDYTTEEKTKLAGILAGAQVNPTNVSAFVNDAGYLTQHQDISGKEDKMIIEEAEASPSDVFEFPLMANVAHYYTFDDVVNSREITLVEPQDRTHVQTIVFFMTIGDAPDVTFGSMVVPIYYHDGFELEAGKTYEVNALFNGSAWVVTAVEIFIPEPMNIITYSASAKLVETTDEDSDGLHTNAFSGTSGQLTITSHTFENGVGTIEFNGDITSIGQGAFSRCSGLTSVTIPSGVTSIGENAFYNCSGLTSITIPDSVTGISNYAFSGCSALTSITIGNSVTSIGSFAFQGCEGLTSITIPDSVTSIGIFAFSGCSGLTSINIPNSVTNIVYSAFSGCKSLTSVTIGSGVTSIDNYVFTGCSSLTNIVVDSANTVFDSRDNCNAIIKTSTNELRLGCKNTVIPNTVTSIGNGAFYGCSGLTSITIPDSVTSIGDSAFSGCSALTSINIPDSVTGISNYAFTGCTSLTSITSNATTAPTIQSDTFRDVKTGGTLTVPSGSTGYDTWMSTGDYYLGKYNWTKVEQ